ncbi:MAG: hypothetical protein SGJ09_16380 [Phycisphaerae bacterium]|nr:hypothetical protein [Phycisphaerae bacterium]
MLALPAAVRIDLADGTATFARDSTRSRRGSTAISATTRGHFASETAAGFEGRLWQELKDGRVSRYCSPVDLDAFLTGKRRLLPSRPDGQHTRELKMLEFRYRILMAPPAPKEDCLALEGALVDLLRRSDATLQYLANGDNGRGYSRGGDLDVEVVPSSSLVGLYVPPE